MMVSATKSQWESYQQILDALQGVAAGEFAFAVGPQQALDALLVLGKILDAAKEQEDKVLVLQAENDKLRKRLAASQADVKRWQHNYNMVNDIRKELRKKQRADDEVFRQAAAMLRALGADI